MQDANPFTEEFHARIVRTGFDQWFPVPAGGAAPPAVWKMNMLVLLMLYPIVFLFGFFVQTPFLTGRGLPFAIALFIGNIVSVVLLSYLVPWMAERFSWWLQPAGAHPRRIEVAGVGARGRALRRDAPGVLAAVLSLIERAAGGPHGQCVSGIPQVTRLRERLVRNAAPAPINAIF